MLRLVRDEDDMEVEDPEQEAQDQAPDGIVAEQTDAEPPDQAESDDGAAEIEIDLGQVEALRLSTPHPLTAGRRAE